MQSESFKVMVTVNDQSPNENNKRALEDDVAPSAVDNEGVFIYNLIRAASHIAKVDSLIRRRRHWPYDATACKRSSKEEEARYAVDMKKCRS